MTLKILLSLACLLWSFLSAPVRCTSYFALPDRVNAAAQDQLLNRSLVVPDENSTPFNSKLWKTDLQSRRHMLFDLYHCNWISNATVIQDLLGKPDEIKDESREYRDLYYELGLQNGHYTFLEVVLRSGSPYLMRIQQRYLDTVPQVLPDWTEKNERWETLAEEYNRQYFIVGMPTRLIAQLGGPEDFKAVANGDPNSIQKCGTFEFQFTSDASKIKHFRMNYVTAQGVAGCTKWEETDLRKDPRSMISSRDFMDSPSVLMGSESRIFNRVWDRFEPGDWNRDGISSRRLVSRSSTLASVTRSYPLIGMSREQIKDLIGNGYRVEYSKKEINADPHLSDVDQYQLTFAFCGNAGRDVFDVSYKDNRVVAYRSRYVGGSYDWKVSSGRRFYISAINDELGE